MYVYVYIYFTVEFCNIGNHVTNEYVNGYMHIPDKQCNFI